MEGVLLVLGTSETVAVAVTVVATLVVVALGAAVAWLIHEARRLHRATTTLRLEAEAQRAELAAALAVAEAELRRVDQLVGSAESISEVVGSASRLASTAMAGPVIKAVALGSGAAEASRRLRRRSAGQPRKGS